VEYDECWYWSGIKWRGYQFGKGWKNNFAHTYIINSMTHLGDNATVTGTVDGIPVTVTCNYSAITQQPSTAAFQNFIAPLMLAQAFPAQPVADNSHNGSFTQ
jgi:hypothetical protein